MHIIRCGNLLFDIGALQSITHHCDPAMCRKRRSCCATYQICVTPSEVQTICGCMKRTARYAKHLSRQGTENIFDQVDGNNFEIDTDEDGLCLLAYRSPGGKTLCSLHSAAFDLRLPPSSTKPRSCRLWPISMTTGRTRLVSVTDDVFDFPCNKIRRARNGTLDAGIREIIGDVFGAKALACICRKLRKQSPAVHGASSRDLDSGRFISRRRRASLKSRR